MIPPILLNDDRSERVRYDFADYPIYIRRSLLSEYPGQKAPNHWHDDIEFISVLSGRMKYYINGEIFDLCGGEGIFVNSGQMHFGFSYQNRECDFLCILFHPMLLCSSFSLEKDFVLPLLRNNGLPFLALDSGVPWQQEILSQLSLLHQNRAERSAPMRALSSFSLIWSLLWDHAPADSCADNRQGQDLTIIKNMVGFIQENYQRRLSLAEIAASGAVGQSKCCKLFAKYFSKTPNEYLNQYRVDKSLGLLQNTDLSVTEIALATGFNSASYYAETFRRLQNASPTEFRARMARSRGKGSAGR